jgi:hypothetical protein
MNLKEEFNLTMEELNRDLYIRGEIWNVGDVVKTTDGDEGTIIRKGTNYVVFEDLRRVWLHNLEEVKQDKDIKDKEGTQPAKYYAKDADGDEMSVSTKKKRASHFAKKKSGPAPGDANADTKPSKHTKKFKDMFGERAKNAVAGNKVQKLVTAHGLKFKGKVYKEIDMELKGIDNNTQMVTFNIIHPKEIFGNEVKVAFKVLRRGPFMATDTSKINEDDGCWDTHKQVGMKKKNGKMVPNCVPKDEEVSEKEDPDLKKKKGTQPAKYFAKDAEGDEMAKSTKDKRDAHFKKQAKKDDDTKSAYKPAPGDATAKTKPSKYTNKMKKLFPDLYKEMVDESATKSLQKKADASGISLSILKKVFDRGLAVVPGRCPPFHAASPLSNTFFRILSEIPEASAFFCSDFVALSSTISLYKSGNNFFILFVYLDGLVFAVASPGAGLYADLVSSSFFACFLK